MKSLKILTWNVNGIRAGIKKGLWGKLRDLDCDLHCFQETKSDKDVMSLDIVKEEGFDYAYNSCDIKKGYSGVAIYYRDTIFTSKNSELEQDLFSNSQLTETKTVLEWDHNLEPEFDTEGRFIATFFKHQDHQIALINCYYPQGGREFRIPYKLRFYKKVLDKALFYNSKGFKVILTGDFNTTFADIDLARPKENRKTTGCLPQEREVLEAFCKAGFVDAFRQFYPDKSDVYTYWDQISRARDRNVGWRIDFFLVDTNLMPFVKDVQVLDKVFGSDHCPVLLEII
jgi:exodeoxyribonuclease III